MPRVSLIPPRRDGRIRAIRKSPTQISKNMFFCISGFSNILDILDSCIASRRPGRYLKTFLEPVAPSWFNISPFRPTATPFVPKITYTTHPAGVHRTPSFVGRPVSLWVDLTIYSLSKFRDPSRLLRNALLCRHFSLRSLNELRRVKLHHIPSEKRSKQAISGSRMFLLFLCFIVHVLSIPI